MQPVPQALIGLPACPPPHDTALSNAVFPEIYYLGDIHMQ